MKKLLTLFTALLLFGSMTVVQAKYCVAHNPNTLSSKNWDAGAEEMTQIGTTGIYSITYNNVGTSQVQFKVTDGSWSNSWATFDNALSEITLSTTNGNASFTLGSTSNVTIYFISSSKKIYVYTAGNIPYTIAGVSELMGSDWNTTAGAGNDMVKQSDGITFTLTRQNVSLSAGNKSYKVVKNHAWGTGEYPSSGNNTLNIASAGNYDVTFTYKPGLASLTAVATPVVTPTVSFENLPSTVAVGHTISFSATSQNIANPVYTFKVKKGAGSYGSAVTSYNFDATGTYTVKVEADGDASAHAEATQDISVIDGHILYYVKTNSWSQINAYMWGDGTTAGMGLPMYLTSATTAKHSYPVYAAAFTQNYTGGLFNNGAWGDGNQTSDQTLNFSKPYFYNNEWFASLEECDPLAGVDFDGLAAQIAKGTVVNFAATSVGIDAPTYRFYVMPEGGSYGSAITSYTFNEVGKFVAKVEALESSVVVASRTKDIEVYTTYTFHKDDVIKVDFTDMTEGSKKVNFPFGHVASGDPLDYDENGAGTIKTITFTEDVEWSTLQDFIKTEKNNWIGLKFQVPPTNYTIAKVAADGASFTWMFDPQVELSGFSQDFYYVGDAATLSSSSNLTNASYSYEVKIDEGEYVELENNPYTFADAGEYTFKVTATGDEGSKSVTQTVNVYNPLTLYFVNKEGWPTPYIYIFTTDYYKAWPGEAMTLTEAKTEKNEYAVYSYTFPANLYSKVIFSNNDANQTADLDIVPSTPYRYNGEWFATLAECDPNQSADFTNVAATILQGTNIEFAATSTNITNPAYTYYVKADGGEYGDAVTAYNFDALGKFVVKVEATGDNTESAIVREKNVEVYATRTYHNGEVIKVDFSDVSGDVKGVNFPYNNTSESLNHDANGAGTIKTITFNTDVTWSTLQDFIKTEKDGWNAQKFTLPNGYQNIVKVAADGASYYWTLEPAVNITNLNDAYIVGEQVSITATTNLTNPSYSYQLKIDEGEFATLEDNPYTFAATGEYTFKVTVTGDEGELAATKTVSVYEPLTLYFVNKEDWSNIHAYAYGANDVKNANWPGETMTATGESTTRNSYAVYSITIPAGRYTTAIFNNGNGGDGNQTENMTIDPEKPYYYDGEWYATLAECDQPVTKIFLVGSIMGWDAPNAYRFMKENEDSKEASVTVNITEYSDISFKLVDNGNWRGCNPQKTITKDDNTVTILADASGENVLMTPYAAGDYIFTIDLDPESDTYRQITVTYPEGEAMPIPQNIYLACDVLNEWAPADPDYKFTVDEDLATLEVTLAENTDYAFKLVHNGSWYGANYNFNYYWNTDVQMVYEATQANLNAFKAGTYTFKYTISTNKLTIHFKETDATEVAISQYEYATLYSATGFDVPDEVEAYIITGLDGIHLTTERIYRIPANTGVLLHAPQGNYDFYEGDSRYMGVDVSANMMKGTVADQVINNELVHYILSLNSENVVGLYWPYGTGANYGVGSFENKAGKAYLEIPAASQPQSVVARRGFPLSPGAGMPTGIEMTNDQLQITNKRIVNGQLYIILDGATYNAQGARVQ